MKNEKFIQVKGSTWYIDAIASVPVYFLNDREVILIDSGYDCDRELIKAVLDENNLTVKAAIASHCHVDHVGNFNWLRSTYGAELIIPEAERWIVSDIASAAYLYRSIHASIIEEDVKHIFFEPDRTYLKDASEIEICGATFKLIFAPGHTVGHTIIVTPDDVCYLGDIVLCEDILARAKMLTSNDWATDFKTKEMVLTLNYPIMLLGHRGVCNDLPGLIEKNNEKRRQLIDTMMNILKTKEEWTMDEILRAYYKNTGMHTYKVPPMNIYRRNLICLIEYLLAADLIKCNFSEGTLVYSVSSK